MNALQKLTDARSLLVLDHCFWGVLAMRLKLIENKACDTAAVDGDAMYFNPEYVAPQSLPIAIAIVAHEVLHLAMGDIWRGMGKEWFIWNMACDFVNNLILKDAGFTLGEGWLIDEQYRNKSKEEVYAILMKNVKIPKIKIPVFGSGKGKDGKGKGNGKGSNNPGLRDPGKGGSMLKPENIAKAEQSKTEWKIAVAQAVQLGQGSIPSNLKRLIDEEVLDPPLPYTTLLRDFLQRTAKNDYNWIRPNRKYISQGLILPSLISDELPMVGVGIDTSGSCDHVQAHFAKELSGILSSFQTTTLVMFADATVHKVEEYRTEDLPIKLEPMGGGGTNFCPVFNYIEKEGIMPSCLIYLTDLWGDFPTKEPDYPVIWVSIDKNRKAPWGQTIYMDVKFN